MTNRPSQDIRSEHEEVFDLLPRFIEIERRNGNAAEIYPEAAAHIAACDICQFTVSVVMTDLPGFDAPPDSKLRAADLPFMRQPRKTEHSLRPGSRRENYSIHINFPLLHDPEPDTEIARSGTTAFEVPMSGLSLGNYSLEIDGGELGVTLTAFRELLDTAADRIYIVADLLGDLSLVAHGAMLIVGSQLYSAPVVDRSAEFLDIDFGVVPDQITLVLES